MTIEQQQQAPARPHPSRREPTRLLRYAADHLLEKRGYVLTGRGGLSRLDSYTIERFDVPVPTTSSLFGPITFEVDLDRVTTPCGFSYHPDGWHPYRDTLAELLAEPDLPYERTTLARFYDTFQPTSVQQALLEDVEEPLAPICDWPALLPLFKHLWSLTPRHLQRILRDQRQVKGARQQFGPQPPEFGRYQVERLVRSHDSIARGYDPEAYPDGFLTGYFLMRGDDYRFMVFHGNHRLAAFERLGIERPLALVHRGPPPVVRAERLERWISGRYGIFPAEVAQRLFDKLFTETGRPKAERLGLL